MVLTILTLLIALGSLLLALSSLRMAAIDTFQVLYQAAVQTRASGQFVSRGAFAVLWVLIFALCYA